MSKLTVLSFDPGKINFSFSVSDVHLETGLKYRIKTTGMIENTVTDLTGDIESQSRRFKREVQKIIKGYGADVLIAERFQVRGRFMGGSAELINIMLGIMATSRIEKKFITAAQWKNSFNKVYDLKKFYKEIPLVDHRIDAALIGIYGSSFFTGSKHFDCIRNDIDKCRDQIIKTQ